MAFDLGQKDSHGNLYLLSPKMDSDLRERLICEWKKLSLKDHVFIASSGTSNTSKIKTYALSFDALFNNAKAVNEFLQIKNSDHWLASLPYYHVGGLSIYLRAHLTSTPVSIYDQKWDAACFMDKLESTQATLTSLVPTQLYDLLLLDKKCPVSLRGVFIGGDFLSTALKEKAMKAGWPIILTYGMTEACSQIATSFAKDSEDNFLDILPHHEISKEGDEFVLRSSSLFTLEMIFDQTTREVFIKKTKGHHILPDLLKLEGKRIKPLGRKGDEVKISGRLVNLIQIREVSERVFLTYNVYGKALVSCIPSDRLGLELVLILDESYQNLTETLLNEINKALAGPIKVQKFKHVHRIEMTEIGKVKTYKPKV